MGCENTVTLERQNLGCVKREKKKLKLEENILLGPRAHTKHTMLFIGNYLLPLEVYRSLHFLFISFPKTLNSNLEKTQCGVYIRVIV